MSSRRPTRSSDRKSDSSKPRQSRSGRSSASSSTSDRSRGASSLPQLLEENAVLQSRNQLLLMYSSFQTEMPSDGNTRIGTWLQSHLQEHGLPSLIRFGPRYRPQVLRRDEFKEWFAPLLSQG